MINNDFNDDRKLVVIAALNFKSSRFTLGGNKKENNKEIEYRSRSLGRSVNTVNIKLRNLDKK